MGKALSEPQSRFFCPLCNTPLIEYHEVQREGIDWKVGDFDTAIFLCHNDECTNSHIGKLLKESKNSILIEVENGKRN